eukprot:1159903-Pelagomonas_calceolata.AAC.4
MVSCERVRAVWTYLAGAQQGLQMSKRAQFECWCRSTDRVAFLPAGQRDCTLWQEKTKEWKRKTTQAEETIGELNSPYVS